MQLQAGTYVTDITPPLELGLLTSSVKGSYAPFGSVRLPLKARVLVLRSGTEMTTIVALDLLGLSDTSVGGWQRFKESIADLLPADRIILTCTHTHNGPESTALSELYRTPSFRTWLLNVQHKLRQSIRLAVEALRPCTVSVSLAELEAWSLQRRVPTAAGIMMSDALQPISTELLNRGPVDRRVHIITLREKAGAAIATLVHAICHPVHEMCMPHVSPDFPGEMCLALETGDHGMPMFLNGAAGDINPPTVSSGPEYAYHHGNALAALVQHPSGAQPLESTVVGFAHAELPLATQPAANITNKEDALARLRVVRIGTLAIVFLPGEAFIETAFGIEHNSPFEHTIVVGYAENNIGYIPTTTATEQGGYEVGPGKWSYLEKGSDRKIVSQVLQLLEKLYNTEIRNANVYENKYNP